MKTKVKFLPKTGFALVELVMALGIAAFALTAIFGLFAVGIGSSRESADDTVLPAIANEIFGELRAESFEKLLTDHGGSPSVTAGNAPPSIPLPARYYDGTGIRLVSADEDITEMDPKFNQAAFVCRVVMQGDEDTLGGVIASQRDVNLLRVSVEFRPAKGGNASNTKIFHGTIARF